MTAPSVPPSPKPPRPADTIAAPTGTRDLYPIELARRRFIEDQWRKVAIRHGFDEIDGPTFEHASLYAVKSGDGILGELFQTFSGKDEERVKKMGAALATGERGGDAMAPYALRPEFTPTLARMYAARAKQLPQPTKWFWQGPCFRAERPQRGRLREFWQWNCDIIGAPPSAAPGAGTPTAADASTSPTRERGGTNTTHLDAEIIAVCVDLLSACGLTPHDVRVRCGSRAITVALATQVGVGSDLMDAFLLFLDREPKLDPQSRGDLAEKMGIAKDLWDRWRDLGNKVPKGNLTPGWDAEIGLGDNKLRDALASFHSLATAPEIGEWCSLDLAIVRGLAYYTGMVFEVIVDGERAIAGGGRYDNLIELFGGPPTPAVGFGMGDVVLSLILQDKKGPDGKPLMPSDRDIAAALGLRPDAFVISNGTPESDAQVAPLLAALRRAGMHARRSYKATKNIGKLLKEASDAGAVRAIIIENGAEATLKNLDTNTQHPQRVPLADIAKTLPTV